MRHHLMHRLMMRAEFLLVLIGVLLTYKSAGAAECTSIKGIASNKVINLTGSKDTLWTLTFEEPDRYAVNTLSGDGNLSGKITQESNWNAQYLCNTKKSALRLSYAAGITVGIVDTNWQEPNDLLVFSKTPSGIKQRKVSFSWPVEVINNENMHVAVVDLSTDGSRFYCACLDGGVVQWDPETESTVLLTPGLPARVIDSLVSVGRPDPSMRVTAVSAFNHGLIVTTPKKVWKYMFDTQLWDSTITTTIDRSGYTISSFESAFINERSRSTSLYGIIAVNGTPEERDSATLCRYDTTARLWRVLQDNAPRCLTTGHGGVIYTVSGHNRIEAIVDTLDNSAFLANPVPVVAQTAFQDSMVSTFEVEYPEYIYDILYTESTDSTGNLWIATSDGLFLSQNVSPKKIIRSCNLVKRAPSVASGLEKTYARPGILKSGIYDSKSSRAVFVYNLSKDAKVAIRVYDYNMDHVKTVISGKLRKAGNNGGPFGRSTVESEDFWDGKNEGGKMVAPGVYYYKITTNKGERAFGKLIVAK